MRVGLLYCEKMYPSFQGNKTNLRKYFTKTKTYNIYLNIMVVTFMKIMMKLCSYLICYSQEKKKKKRTSLWIHSVYYYNKMPSCKSTFCCDFDSLLCHHLYFLVSRRLLLIDYRFTFFVYANMYNVIHIYLVYNIKYIQICIIRDITENFCLRGPRLKDHILSIYVFLDPLIIAIVNFKHQC